MTYLISKFFNADVAKTLESKIKDADWYDGLESLFINARDSDKNPYLLKDNYQADMDPTQMFEAMDNNDEFINFTFPNHTKDPLFTKTELGGHYSPHFDDVTNGQFSTTVFLSDPKDYEGGELVLYIRGKEEKFKLEPGFGITYETGTPHCVKAVTEGQRIVSVFWTTSIIWDIEALREYRYWNMMAKRYKPKFVYDNTIDFVNCLHNHFSMKADTISRKFAIYYPPAKSPNLH